MIYILISILFLFILIVIILYGVYLVNSFFTDAPYVPVKKRVIDKIIETLNLNENAVLYDLGCGDGRVLLEAIKKRGVKAIGVEKNFIVYLFTKYITRKTSIKIICKDIDNVSIKDATHIYLYLFPKIMDKLKNKILLECQKGTRIVSCSFMFASILPDEVIELPQTKDRMCQKLYVYILK